jgi:hypothetical protein
MRVKTLAVIIVLMMVLSVMPAYATLTAINSDNGSANGTGGPFGQSQQTSVVRDTNGNLFFPDYSGDTGTATQRQTAFGLTGAPAQDLEDRPSGTYTTLISKVTTTAGINSGTALGLNVISGTPVFVNAGNCKAVAATSCTITLTLTSGNALVLFSTQSATTTSISSVTALTGASWISCTTLSACLTNSGPNLRNELWYINGFTSSGSTAITITFSASTNSATVIGQYSGITSVSTASSTNPTGNSAGYVSIGILGTNGFSILGFSYAGTVTAIAPTANRGLELWVSGNSGSTWTRQINDLSDLATDPTCIPVAGISSQQPALNLHGTNMLVAVGCFPGPPDAEVISYSLTYSGPTFSSFTRQASNLITFTFCNGCGSMVPDSIFVVSSTTAIIAFLSNFSGQTELGIFSMSAATNTNLAGGAGFTEVTPTTMCGSATCVTQLIVALQPVSLDLYLVLQGGATNIDYIRFTKSGATWSQGSSTVLSTDALGPCCGYDTDQNMLYVAWMNNAQTNFHLEYVNSAGVWTDFSPTGNCATACMAGTATGVFVMVPHSSNAVSYTVSFPANLGSGRSAYITQTTSANTAVRVSYDCGSTQCTPGWTSTTNPMGYRDLSTSFVWGARTDNTDVPGTGIANNYGSRPSLMALTCDGTSTTTFCPGSGTGLTVFSYSLSNNSPKTINQGATGTVIITLTKISGPSNSVTLSCSGLPSGITCNSFSSNPITPTTTDTLTVGVSQTKPGGTYTFTVDGSPASTGATTVTIVVPTYDFALTNNGPITVSRISLTGTSSGSATVTATVTSGGGQPETFSCGSMPSGFSACTITNSPCTPTCAVDVAFTIQNSNARTSYTFTVTASPLGATTVPTTVTVVFQNAPCFNDAGGNSCVFTSCDKGTCGTNTGSLVGSLLMLFIVLLGVYVLHEKVGNADGGRKEKEYGGVSERD